MRTRVVASVAAAWLLAVPAPVLALSDYALQPETESAAVSGISMGAGFAALVIAVVLLGEVFSLVRVADGSAIADNVDYVVAGVACIGASVLAGWVSRWVDGLASVQARIGQDLLILMAMVFLGIYFYRVRRALTRFLSGAAAAYESSLAAVQVQEAEETADA